MSVSKDFEELFACLNARKARFLVVGAYAVAFHDKPRFTKDIDLFLEPTRENARRVLEALNDFGFGGLELSEGDLCSPDRFVQLGVPPNRVDLLTAIDGVGFQEAWAGRASGRYGNEPVAYIGRTELIRNKLAAGRAQDRIDAERLKEGRTED